MGHGRKMWRRAWLAEKQHGEPSWPRRREQGRTSVSEKVVQSTGLYGGYSHEHAIHPIPAVGSISEL
jgi:hypothetical protein